MTRKIFVNLPVSDLPKSKNFFTALGFTINPQFTDETAACVVVSEEIYVMLLTGPRFQDFTPKQICDSRQSTEVMLCLSCDSRAEVDRLGDTALAHGGQPHMPAVENDFMYLRTIQDPDGHVWELVWMDPAVINAAPPSN